jgi:DNA-binding response OmpR family regulator
MRNIAIIHSCEKTAGIYSRHLSEHFQVKIAHTGIDGIRLIRSFKPHLILAQYELPKLSGMGVLKFVKKKFKHPSPPVVLVSRLEAPYETLSLGVAEWIKIPPASVEELKGKIILHALSNKIV